MALKIDNLSSSPGASSRSAKPSAGETFSLKTAPSGNRSTAPVAPHTSRTAPAPKKTVAAPQHSAHRPAAPPKGPTGSDEASASAGESNTTRSAAQSKSAATDTSTSKKASTVHAADDGADGRHSSTSQEDPNTADSGAKDPQEGNRPRGGARTKGPSQGPSRGISAQTAAIAAAKSAGPGQPGAPSTEAATAGDFLHLLEQTLGADHSATPASDADSPAPTLQSEDTASHSKDSDQNATLLASQSLVTLSLQTTAPAAAPASCGQSSAPTSDAVRSAGPSGAQMLATLLAHDAATEQKVKTGDAPQTDPVPKPAADSSAAVATGAPASLAHLGVASHFSLQHLRTEGSSPTLELQQPVGTPAWNDELGTQLTWMSHQGLDSASLRVSPEHLGPVEVRISVHNGDASVWFGASQADTRAALQQALPHLRAMFASQGMTLSDSGVSREPPRQGRTLSSTQLNAVAPVAGADSTHAASHLSLGLVDTYA